MCVPYVCVVVVCAVRVCGAYVYRECVCVRCGNYANCISIRIIHINIKLCAKPALALLASCNFSYSIMQLKSFAGWKLFSYLSARNGHKHAKCKMQLTEIYVRQK